LGDKDVSAQECRIAHRDAVKETVLKHTSLSKLASRLSFALTLSICVAKATFVHASMSCLNFNALSPSVSDPLIFEKLQAHAKTLAGFGRVQIGQLDRRFFIVSSDDERCREGSLCYYRLVVVRDGEVKDLFAFQGSGKSLRIWSPLALWLEPLQDEYSWMAFETRENTYLTVQLPSSGNTVLVVPETPEEIKMNKRICDHHPR
jgi:hypothetical protein